MERCTTQVVIPLCDSLGSILCFFCDMKEEKDLGQTKIVFAKLKHLKFFLLLISYIYCLGHQRSFKTNLRILQLFIVILRFKFPKS